jgi:enoyl-[acyl-carrier protein] reductase III
MVKEFATHKYWAVILGGSSGLGLAAAKKLAAHGMNLCLIHRNTRSELTAIDDAFLKIKQQGTEVLSFNIDVIKPESRKTVLDGLRAQIGKGKVRCLLHSIAKGNLKAMTSEEAPALEKDDFLLTFHNMALTLYEWTKQIKEGHLFASDARVISFTSEGAGKAIRNYAAVSSAKAALEAITRSIALEFAPYGIRANCIQAGVTETRSLKMIPGNEKIIEQTINRNPYQRLTTPEDVANVVYLLCRDEAAWINGSVIPVDGGEHIS